MPGSIPGTWFPKYFICRYRTFEHFGYIFIPFYRNGCKHKWLLKYFRSISNRNMRNASAPFQAYHPGAYPSKRKGNLIEKRTMIGLIKIAGMKPVFHWMVFRINRRFRISFLYISVTTHSKSCSGSGSNSPLFEKVSPVNIFHSFWCVYL